jgi:copper homeostasis protein
MVELEICANSIQSALNAQEGGASRVEFCDNMAEGGTTQSYGQIAVAKQLLDIPIYPIIRPRGGDFLYSDLEFEVMKADVMACRDLQCAGVVFGILQIDGCIDVERCRILKELAAPMPVAFHRAFDLTENMEEALETLIDLGFERVLSSGGAETARAGATRLALLIKQAGSRIQVMPGAGIRPENVMELLGLTSAKAVHASLSVAAISEMSFRNNQASMSSGIDAYAFSQTSLHQVRETVALLDQD